MRELVTASEPQHVWVDRKRALFSAWYEFFPRSEGPRPRARRARHLRHRRRAPARRRRDGLRRALPAADPPDRPDQPQGPEQHARRRPDDVGSPWAIGAAEGGHDAIHPDLGTLEDFRRFVAAARDNGLEVAMDLALQCAPDHPWVNEHPEWFTTRADGTIAYAENPPKKYQDIYPLNFDNDPEGIRAEVLRIVLHWVARASGSSASTTRTPSRSTSGTG